MAETDSIPTLADLLEAKRSDDCDALTAHVQMIMEAHSPFPKHVYYGSAPYAAFASALLDLGPDCDNQLVHPRSETAVMMACIGAGIAEAVLGRLEDALMWTEKERDIADAIVSVRRRSRRCCGMRGDWTCSSTVQLPSRFCANCAAELETSHAAV